MSVRRVEIDDELLEKAMRILGVHTIKEAVNTAIEKVAQSEERHQRLMERHARIMEVREQEDTLEQQGN